MDECVQVWPPVLVLAPLAIRDILRLAPARVLVVPLLTLGPLNWGRLHQTLSKLAQLGSIYFLTSQWPVL
jgi:hypothetical protein